MIWYIFLVVGSASAQSVFHNMSSDNWTTCEEFLRNDATNISEIVDIDWKIFYFWDPSADSSYHIRFSLPSTGLVDRFRVELEKDLRDVNWNDSVLFMETGIDLSALFIKTNVTGVYRVIPSLAFGVPYCPYMVFAIKVVEPGYLGIENCKGRYAYGLAPLERFPRDDQLVEAASKLKFWNSLGRSYLAAPPPRPKPLRYEDDEIGDDELEYDRHPDKSSDRPSHW